MEVVPIESLISIKIRHFIFSENKLSRAPDGCGLTMIALAIDSERYTKTIFHGEAHKTLFYYSLACLSKMAANETDFVVSWTLNKKLTFVKPLPDHMEVYCKKCGKFMRTPYLDQVLCETCL